MSHLFNWKIYENIGDQKIVKRYNMIVYERVFPDGFSPPHWHDFYEIELYLSGSGIANVNGTEYKISPNTLCFLTPSDYHSFQIDPEEPLRMITFLFTPKCIEDSVINELISLCHYLFTKIDDNTANRFISFTRILTEEFRADKYLSEKYTKSITSCILLELLRLLKENTDLNTSFQKMPIPVHKAVYYMHTHFKEDIRLEDIANFVGFSKSHMSKLLNEHLSMSFKEYLINLRLNHSEQLLLLSEESVTNIAYLSGFNSLSNFLHIFTKKYGISPLQFRKNKNT